MARIQLCATVSLLLLFGCSSGEAADGGPAGALDGGGSFTADYAGEDFAPVPGGTTPDLSRVIIHMSQNVWPCDGGTAQGVYLRFEAASDGGGPLTPGTYPMSLFSLQGVDPTTQLPAHYEGDGNVTFTTIDAQTATGSFTVQVSELGGLDGTFDAPFCGLYAFP
jgi:hypothetical protein